jgi:hypothetical protein
MTATQESRPGRESKAAVNLDDTQTLPSVTDKIREMARQSAATAPPLTAVQARLLASTLGCNPVGGSS